MSDSRERIYTVVAMIPAGAVATYGQIAELAGLGRQARQVGYALAALGSDNPESDNPESENDVPWHRVVNAKGEISLRSTASGCEARQRSLLEREGVRFDEHGRIALSLYRWQP
jgi:methylated-DNA-protein-cysteine methyltransferase-like protein